MSHENIKNIKFSQDGKYLMMGLSTGTINVFDINDENHIFEVKDVESKKSILRSCLICDPFISSILLSDERVQTYLFRTKQ